MKNPATEPEFATRHVRTVALAPFEADDKESFVRDNQESFSIVAFFNSHHCGICKENVHWYLGPLPFIR
jgi:hypothetical protein